MLRYSFLSWLSQANEQNYEIILIGAFLLSDEFSKVIFTVFNASLEILFVALQSLDLLLAGLLFVIEALPNSSDVT